MTGMNTLINTNAIAERVQSKFAERRTNNAHQRYQKGNTNSIA